MKNDLNAFVTADPNKCIGCRVCEIACAVAHLDKTVKTVGSLNAPLLPRLYLVKTSETTMPVQCRHCEDAPCVKSCPVSAIDRRDNKIMMAEQRCIGCKSCLLACPFGAIELIAVCPDDSSRDYNVVASKCDLCSGKPKGPACVAACPSQALRYVNIAEERKRRQLYAATKAGNFIKEFRAGGGT